MTVRVRIIRGFPEKPGVGHQGGIAPVSRLEALCATVPSPSDACPHGDKLNVLQHICNIGLTRFAGGPDQRLIVSSKTPS